MTLAILTLSLTAVLFVFYKLFKERTDWKEIAMEKKEICCQCQEEFEEGELYECETCGCMVCDNCIRYLDEDGSQHCIDCWNELNA